MTNKKSSISSIALILSIFTNLYFGFANNDLEKKLKYFETTFDKKQAHYSAYMVLLTRTFYAVNDYGVVGPVQNMLDEIENESYQLQPFFPSNDSFEFFNQLNMKFIGLIYNYEKDKNLIDSYLQVKKEIQEYLFSALFSNSIIGNNGKVSKTVVQAFFQRNWATILTIVGVFSTLILLIFTVRQINSNAKISKAGFWLEIEKMFNKFDELNLQLRPTGEWREKQSFSKEEWGLIEDYMGVFEHCELMMQDKVIDEDRFKKIFSYRIENLVSNESIVKHKLIEEKDSWTTFIELLTRIGVSI